MKRGPRYVLSLALGFVVYRVLIEVMPSTTGLVISLLLGGGTAVAVWKLTGPKQAD